MICVSVFCISMNKKPFVCCTTFLSSLGLFLSLQRSSRSIRFLLGVFSFAV